MKRTLICFFQDNVLALNKRLDHMEWKTEQMERQMDDWDREKGTMDRLTNNTQKAIDELTLVLTLIHVYVKEIGLHYLYLLHVHVFQMCGFIHVHWKHYFVVDVE